MIGSWQATNDVYTEYSSAQQHILFNKTHAVNLQQLLPCADQGNTPTSSQYAYIRSHM